MENLLATVEEERSLAQEDYPVNYRVLEKNTNLNESQNLVLARQCRQEEENDIISASSQQREHLRRFCEGIYRYLHRRFTRRPTSYFESFQLANDYLELVGDIDVISDAESVKDLVKACYGNIALSCTVHRFGNTLLIDSLDVPSFLLRTEMDNWSWMQHLIHETTVAWQQRASTEETRSADSPPFVYPSAHSRGNIKNLRQNVNFLNSSIKALSNEHYSGSDNVERTAGPSSTTRPGTGSSSGVYDWQIEDLRLCIGSDLPIFRRTISGPSTHSTSPAANQLSPPCGITLRLRENCEPINVLTGLDYWLDNLMCNVPEVGMCYHVDGFVQSFEIVKTEDIPSLAGGAFDFHEIKGITKNILAFLRSKVTKEGHTYWLVKEADSDVVKLYDLTSIWLQHDTKISFEAGQSNTHFNNPYSFHVALLLFRIAERMMRQPVEKRIAAENRRILHLLHTCLRVIDMTSFSRSAIRGPVLQLLSQLYTQLATAGVNDVESFGATVSDEDTDAALEMDKPFSLDNNTAGKLLDKQGRHYSLMNIKQLRFADLAERHLERQSSSRRNRRSNRRKEQLQKTSTKSCVKGLHVKAYKQALEQNFQLLDFASKGAADSSDSEAIICRSVPIAAFTPPRDSGLPNYEQMQLPALNRVAELCLHIAAKLSGSAAGNLGSTELSNLLAAFCWLSAAASCVRFIGSISSTYKVSCDVFNELGDVLLYMAKRVELGGLKRSLEVGDTELFENRLFTQLKLYSSGAKDSIGDLFGYLSEKLCDFYGAAVAEDNFSFPVDFITKSFGCLSSEPAYSSVVPLLSDNSTALVFKLLSVCNFCYKQAAGSSSLSLNCKQGKVLNELAILLLDFAPKKYDQSNSSPLLSYSKSCLECSEKMFRHLTDFANLSRVYCNLARLYKVELSFEPFMENGFTRDHRKLLLKAADHYRMALDCLKKSSSESSRASQLSIKWDLTNCYFMCGQLQQDYSSAFTEDQVNRTQQDIIDSLLTALKLCTDVKSPTSKDELLKLPADEQSWHRKFIYRKAAIHYRLASMYHDKLRRTLNSAPSKRVTQIYTSADNHYERALKSYLEVEAFKEWLRALLELHYMRESVRPNAPEKERGGQAATATAASSGSWPVDLALFRNTGAYVSSFSRQVLQLENNGRNTDELLKEYSDLMTVFDDRLCTALRNSLKAPTCSEKQKADLKSFYGRLLRAKADTTDGDASFSRLAEKFRLFGELLSNYLG